MKMIVAMVRPFMLTKVTCALEAMGGFAGMTVTEAHGCGRERSHHEDHADHFVDMKEKARVEIVVRDEMVDRAVETIMRAAHTGKRGDGKVFILPVERAVRIRTGETGDAVV